MLWGFILWLRPLDLLVFLRFLSTNTSKAANWKRLLAAIRRRKDREVLPIRFLTRQLLISSQSIVSRARRKNLMHFLTTGMFFSLSLILIISRFLDTLNSESMADTLIFPLFSLVILLFQKHLLKSFVSTSIQMPGNFLI
jgi:hypothetical protein